MKKSFFYYRLILLNLSTLLLKHICLPIILFLPFFLFSQHSPVIISEVLYDSPLDEGSAIIHEGEFLSLYNYGDINIDISGWKVEITNLIASTQPKYSYTFPNNTAINSQSLAIVASRAPNSTFEIDNFYGSLNSYGNNIILYNTTLTFPNKRSHIKIYDANNILQDEMIYDGESSAPSGEQLLRADNGFKPNNPGNLSVSIQRKNITIVNDQHVFLRTDYYVHNPKRPVCFFSCDWYFYLTITADGHLTDIPAFNSEQSFAPSSSQNYIHIRTCQAETGKQYMDKIQYFDGLGRPIQTVERRASPDKKDIATYTEYNKAGKELQQWLPRATNKANGSYIPLSEFQSLPNAIYNNDASPFTKTIYEASGLNRTVEQYGAGEAWYANNKSVKTEYLTNAGNDCRLYKVENYFLKRQGYYPANSLYVTKTTDEDGKVSCEFKDKLGNVIMTRQQDGSNNHDTYYVYDDFNRLCFVIPPKATDLLTVETASYNPSDNTVIKTLCYTYRYDVKNNCIYKCLPGAEPTIYIYDKADNLILSQNGEQRKKGVWMFYIPDMFGRICLTGTCTNTFEYTAPLKDGLVYVDGLEDYLWETGQQPPLHNPYMGYSVSGITLSNPKVLTANYYDNYNFFIHKVIPTPKIPNFAYNEESGYGMYLSDAKTLLTGTVAAVLDKYDTPSSFLYSVMYYDDKKRCVQKKSSNQMGGYEKEYYAYNFTGQPVNYKHIHSVEKIIEEDLLFGTKVISYDSVTEEYTYTYDHAGRPLRTLHKLNNGIEIILNENTYDEAGRLASKEFNAIDRSVPTTLPVPLIQQYSYNIRGWLTGLYGSLDYAYGNIYETIKYNDNENSIPSWNGNISSTVYGSNGNNIGLNYYYDGLNRLTGAISTDNDGLYSSSYSYDKNGNMLSFNRNEGQSDVDITCFYMGNQLALSQNNSLQQAQQMIDDADELSLYERQQQLQELSLAAQQIISYPEQSDEPYYITNGNNNNTDPEPEYVEDPIYFYDKNGNLRADYNKQTTYTYNVFDMPLSVAAQEQNGIIQYIYDALGNKLEANYTWHNGGSINVPGQIGANSSKKIQYVGNKIYKDGELDMILTENGYIRSGDLYYFYLKDHLGNNIAVFDALGHITQQTFYHPYGKPIADFSSNTTTQPFKYGGKEEETMFGLDLLDFDARQFSFDNEMPPIFTQPDMLSEVRPWESPYVYCGNNPILNVDPTGMDYWSTNDPDQIKQFINALGSGSTQFDFSGWQHATDAQITGNLTYNDETNKFYTSYTSVENGVVTVTGKSFDANLTPVSSSGLGYEGAFVYEAADDFGDYANYLFNGWNYNDGNTNWKVDPSGRITGVAPITGYAPSGGRKGFSIFRGGTQAIRDAAIKQYPKEFQRWYHRYYKGNSRGNASKNELKELYNEWVGIGKPTTK